VLWVCDRIVLPVTLELELRDNVEVVLALTDSVADILVLWVWDTDAVWLELDDSVADTAVVNVELDDVVADMLELELLDIDVDGELEITDPAPTATNAIYVD